MADEKKHQKDMNPDEGTPEGEETKKQESSGKDQSGGEAVEKESSDSSREEGASRKAETTAEDEENASRQEGSAPETGEEASGGQDDEGEKKQQKGATISAEEAAALEKGLDWLDSVGEDIPDIPDISDYEEAKQKGEKEKTSQSAIDDLIASVKANSGFNFETNPSGGQKQESEGPASVQPASFPEMEAEAPRGGKDTGMESKIDMLMDIPVQVTVVLGHAQKTIGEIISLEQGAVVELDKIVGEPVDVLANGKLIFKGEVVVIDENFGVRVVELVRSSARNTR